MGVLLGLYKNITIGYSLALLENAREPRGGFEVNLSAVKNAGFSINAKLLMMARQPGMEGAPP